MGCFGNNNNAAGGGGKKNGAFEKYEWFLSEEGLRAFAEYTDGKNYIKEDDIEDREEAAIDAWEYGFESYINSKHPGFKSPRVYFEKLAEALGKEPGCHDALLYVWHIEVVGGLLRLQARPYYTDDNGEPLPTNAPGGDYINDVNKNPILKFVRDFRMYNFGDESLDWKTKCQLWHEAVWFVYHEVTRDRPQVLEANPWLFEKDSYFTSLGTLKTKKGFLTVGLEKSNNPDYFKKELANLDK